jgi:hypothetical protein
VLDDVTHFWFQVHIELIWFLRTATRLALSRTAADVPGAQGGELYVYILISAELIGVVYYRALEVATDCQRLMVLCRGLVSDELAHVGVESQLLLALRAGRAAPVQALTRMASSSILRGIFHERRLAPNTAGGPPVDRGWKRARSARLRDTGSVLVSR